MSKVITTTLGLVLCIAAATWWVFKIHGAPQIGIDDANICFSYSENLAAGRGITFGHNSERVEGATSMLWMLVSALLFWLGFSERAVLIVSVLILVVTQWLYLDAIHRHATKRNGMAWLSQGCYLLLLLCSPAYMTWMTITLMDTCLWGLIIASMTWVVIWPPSTNRARMFAAIPFVLAPLARPEGMLAAPLLCGLLWLRAPTSAKRSYATFCLGMGSAIVVSTVALTGFRLSYFGAPLPNTFYAKVSPSLIYNLRQGKEYLYEYVVSGPMVGCLVGVVLSIAAAWFGRTVDKVRTSKSCGLLLRAQMRAPDVSALVACALLFLPVLTGGDHFAMFRFYQPVYPVMCMTVVLLASDTWTRVMGRERVVLNGSRICEIAAVGCVAIYWLFAYAFVTSWSSVRWGSPIDHEFRIAEEGRDLGTTLGDLFAGEPQYPLVGVIKAGGIARTYPGPIVDLMGLNNAFIGHFKGDRKGMRNHAAFEREAFYHEQPDILLATPPAFPVTDNFDSQCVKGLFHDERFRSQWRYGEVSLPGDAKQSSVMFVRKSFLAELLSTRRMSFRDTMIWSNGWVNVSK